jgi:hypothetical protein
MDENRDDGERVRAFPKRAVVAWSSCGRASENLVNVIAEMPIVDEFSKAVPEDCGSLAAHAICYSDVCGDALGSEFCAVRAVAHDGKRVDGSPAPTEQLEHALVEAAIADDENIERIPMARDLFYIFDVLFRTDELILLAEGRREAPRAPDRTRRAYRRSPGCCLLQSRASR